MWTPPDPPPRDRHLTREEFDKLLAAAEFPHIRLFCILAIGTLAREEAILDLTWVRCDFDRKLIYLQDPGQPATNKGRAIVPMNDAVFSALQEAAGGALTDHVIEWDGKPVKSIKRSLRTALKKAGIRKKGDGAHLLRHSGTVWMAESGVPMEEISQYLGHKRIETTRRIYACFSPDYLRKAAAAVDVKLQASR